MHGIIVALALLFASLANAIALAGHLAPAHGMRASAPAVTPLVAAQKS